MKHKLSRSTTLPEKRSKNIAYAYHAIDLLKKGCYDEHRNLRIDGGLGDTNMPYFDSRIKETTSEICPLRLLPNYWIFYNARRSVRAKEPLPVSIIEK